MVPVSPLLLLLLASCPLLSSVPVTFLRPGEAELVAAEGGEAVMECGVTNLASNHLVRGKYMSQMLYAGQSARPSVTFLSDLQQL